MTKTWGCSCMLGEVEGVCGDTSEHTLWSQWMYVEIGRLEDVGLPRL